MKQFHETIAIDSEQNISEQNIGNVQIETLLFDGSS